MKNIYIASILILFLIAVPVSAHVTLTDKEISAFVHIEPLHEPVPKEPSEVFVAIDNKDHTFEISSCDCVLKISNEAGILVNEKLAESTSGDTFGIAAVPVTFPEEGIYKVEVSGTPRTEGVFTPFSSSYDLRVSYDNAGSEEHAGHSKNEHLGHYILFGGMFLVMGGIFMYDKRKDRRLEEAKNTTNE